MIAFLLTFYSTANSQSRNPFSTLKFDKVLIYDFEGGKGSDLYIIDEKGALAKSITKQVQLHREEANTLSSLLGNRRSYGGATASCFEPHLGIVYYLNGKVVGHITVCLDCNRLRSSIDIPAQKQGKVGTGKSVYYMADGLSTSFRQYLNKFIQKNGFSHQIKNG